MLRVHPYLRPGSNQGVGTRSGTFGDIAGCGLRPMILCSRYQRRFPTLTSRMHGGRHAHPVAISFHSSAKRDPDPAYDTDSQSLHDVPADDSARESRHRALERLRRLGHRRLLRGRESARLERSDRSTMQRDSGSISVAPPPTPTRPPSPPAPSTTASIPKATPSPRKSAATPATPSGNAAFTSSTAPSPSASSPARTSTTTEPSKSAGVLSRSGFKAWEGEAPAEPNPCRT